MPLSNNGVSHQVSAESVAIVLDRLLSLLKMRPITVFAVVDHSGEAAKAGFEMHDTKLVIFGNPKVGTPLMLAAPDSAIDLPLKILIAEQPDGTTKVSYNDPDYVMARFGLPSEMKENIGAIKQIVTAIVAEAQTSIH